MAERPLRAYKGDESYIFVAYSHEDSGLVYPQIRWLQDQGFNIVWDEGVSPGAVWRKEIAAAIRDCSLLLYFTTPNSVVSEHCTREVNFALDDHHRPVLAVHVLKTVLPDALALSLSDRQAILQHELEPKEYERKLITSIASYLEQPVPVIQSSLAAPPSITRRRVWAFFALVSSMCVGGAVAAFVTWSAIRPIESTAVGMQLPLSLQHFSHHQSQFRNLALSPDGHQIAYIGAEAGETFLYVKNMDSPLPDKFPGTSGAATPFYSPDGKWIGFYSKGKIRRSPASGGSPVEITSSAQLQRGLSWGDDGAIVFSPGFRSSLWRVAAGGGGEPTEVTQQEDHAYAQHTDPFVLPGSKHVLHGRLSPKPEFEIWLTDLASGDSKYLISGRWPQYYDGKLFFFRGPFADSGSIWVVDFDADALQINGDPVPIVESTHSPFSVSNNGELIYSVPSSKRSSLILIEPSGSESRLMDAESLRSMSISPDGRSLALARAESSQSNIWIFDFETRQPRQLTFDGGREPIWSLDGLRLTYLQPGTGLVERTISSNEPANVLVTTDKNCAPEQYTDKGMLYTCINPQTAGDLYFRSNNGDRTVIEDDESPTTDANISPDGAWIAITRIERGQSNVYIKPFPARGSRVPVPVVNASAPRWAASGLALYVTSFDRLMRVSVSADSTTNTVQFDKPTLIRILGIPVGPDSRPYDVVDDESRIVLVETTYDDFPVQNFVTNWPELLLD